MKTVEEIERDIELRILDQIQNKLIEEVIKNKLEPTDKQYKEWDMYRKRREELKKGEL